jgi:protein arginine kinase activator
LFFGLAVKKTQLPDRVNSLNILGMAMSAHSKCVICGQAARVFVSFVANGKVTAEAWCAEHGAAQGLDQSGCYALVSTENKRSGSCDDSQLRCPVCDCSQRDYEKRGKFGCATCYTTFGGLLAPVLNQIHRGSSHRGKIPVRGADAAVVRNRLVLLQTQLSDAIQSERYEGAAQTRDAINALKSKLLASEATDQETVKKNPPASN